MYTDADISVIKKIKKKTTINKITEDIKQNLKVVFLKIIIIIIRNLISSLNGFN